MQLLDPRLRDHMLEYILPRISRHTLPRIGVKTMPGTVHPTPNLQSPHLQLDRRPPPSLCLGVQPPTGPIPPSLSRIPISTRLVHPPILLDRNKPLRHGHSRAKAGQAGRLSGQSRSSAKARRILSMRRLPQTRRPRRKITEMLMSKGT